MKNHTLLCAVVALVSALAVAPQAFAQAAAGKPVGTMSYAGKSASLTQARAFAAKCFGRAGAYVVVSDGELAMTKGSDDDQITKQARAGKQRSLRILVCSNAGGKPPEVTTVDVYDPGVADGWIALGDSAFVFEGKLADSVAGRLFTKEPVKVNNKPLAFDVRVDLPLAK